MYMALGEDLYIHATSKEHHHPSWKTDDLNLYRERRRAKVPHPSCKTDDLLVGPAWKLRLACKLGSFCKSELRPQNKKEPDKQQRTNSIFLSDFQGVNEIHLAFASSLFYHLLYKSWVSHPTCKLIMRMIHPALCRMGGDALISTATSTRFFLNSGVP